MVEEVLRRVKPSGVDQANLRRVVDLLFQKIKKAASSLRVEVKPLLVGSAARGTWLRSERELDIFLLFSPEVSREQLERKGLALARKVAGTAGKERYAEHPYITMDFEGFQVDLVPCFEVEDPSKIKSAVDRTPHHQRYVWERLTEELRDQVLVLKQFVRGIGVYGAEAKVQGFSGYLCELLILNYKSFKTLVESAAGWKPGVVIDLEQVYPNEAEPRTLFERQPLIVIDPVDPRRNVAAAVSLRSFSTFVLACRDFLERPSVKFFFPKRPAKLTREGFRQLIKRRGTKLCCLWIKHSGLPEDVIYPQLRKTERAIAGELVQGGFEVLRSDVWADDRNGAVLVELSIFRLPPVQARPGPQVTLDVSNFIREHLKSSKRLAGPYVDKAGRVVYELRRMETDGLKSFHRAVSEHKGFGKDVVEGIERRRHVILVGEEISKMFRNRKFAEFVSGYLDPQLPWYR